MPKVIGKLLFGGGKDRADAKKAGAEAAKGYVDGADSDAEAAADAPSGPGDAAAIAEVGATGGEALKAGAGRADTGIPLDDALPKEGQEVPGEDAPAMADAAPALQATADTGMDVTDMVGPDARAGEPATMGQAGEGAIPADALSAPTDALGPAQTSDMASTADMPPLETARTDTVGGDALPPVGAVRAEAEAAGDIPAEAVQTETEAIQAEPGAVTDTPAGIIQTGTEAIREEPGTVPDVPSEAMQATSAAASDMPPGDMQPSVDGAMDIPPGAVQAETEAVADMPPGSIQAATDPATDTPPEEAQVPAEVVADTSTGAGQSPDTAQAGAGTADVGDVAQPDAASAISGLSGIGMAQTAMAVGDTADSGVAKDTASPPAETTRIPPGADASSAGEGTAQAGDALQAGIADVPGPGLAGAAPSGKMGLVSATGGPDVMDGIRQDVAGIVNASPAGAIIAGIKGESAAAEVQDAAQGAGDTATIAGARDAAQGADGIAAVSPEMVPPAGSLAGAGQPPAESMEGISPKVRETVDAAKARPEPPGPGGPGLEGPDPSPDRPGKGMGIRDALDELSGGLPAPGPSAPGGTPSFTLSQTFHISGGDSTKEDVAEAAQMGVREFDKLMQRWMKQNKRGAFGKAMAWT